MARNNKTTPSRRHSGTDIVAAQVERGGVERRDERTRSTHPVVDKLMQLVRTAKERLLLAKRYPQARPPQEVIELARQVGLDESRLTGVMETALVLAHQLRTNSELAKILSGGRLVVSHDQMTGVLALLPNGTESGFEKIALALALNMNKDGSVSIVPWTQKITPESVSLLDGHIAPGNQTEISSWN